MELEEAIKKLRNKVDNWNKCKKDICSAGELYEDIDEENIAIDIVLKELDNRIPKEKIKEKKDWYQETMKYLCKNGIDLDKYERYEEVVNFCEELLNKE